MGSCCENHTAVSPPVLSILHHFCLTKPLLVARAAFLVFQWGNLLLQRDLFFVLSFPLKINTPLVELFKNCQQYFNSRWKSLVPIFCELNGRFYGDSAGAVVHRTCNFNWTKVPNSTRFCFQPFPFPVCLHGLYAAALNATVLFAF